CGVVIASGPTGDATLRTARAAVHRVRARLPFSVWMALAKAQPVLGFDDAAQGLLTQPKSEGGAGTDTSR
ncbi:MAG: hypothetical protein ABIW85_01615, partial [Variovorax sp.]